MLTSASIPSLVTSFKAWKVCFYHLSEIVCLYKLQLAFLDY